MCLFLPDDLWRVLILLSDVHRRSIPKMSSLGRFLVSEFEEIWGVRRPKATFPGRIRRARLLGTESLPSPREKKSLRKFSLRIICRNFEGFFDTEILGKEGVAREKGNFSKNNCLRLLESVLFLDPGIGVNSQRLNCETKASSSGQFEPRL